MIVLPKCEMQNVNIYGIVIVIDCNECVDPVSKEQKKEVIFHETRKIGRKKKPHKIELLGVDSKLPN